MSITELRRAYLRRVCEHILSAETGIASIADVGNAASVVITEWAVRRLKWPLTRERWSARAASRLFEQFTRDFLEESFGLLHHIRPGNWRFSARALSPFNEQKNVLGLHRFLNERPELKAALEEDYFLITPDIVIGRRPVSDDEINQMTMVVDADESVCRLTPLRAANYPESHWILHASISCKWTMRSERAQNIRTEGLNLIRNRKGHTLHIAAVTAEPLPTRLASLALGTGDLDCVYHFALPELRQAVDEVGSPEQREMLTSMIDGRRLRDISDLPLDLAI